MGKGGDSLRIFSSKGLDVHFLHMEDFGLLDPFVDSGGDGGHGKDHGGNLLVNPQGELVNEGNVVSDSSLAGEVLEVGDILLETIISGFIRAANGFLDELGGVQAGSGSGIEWVECSLEVLSKFLEGLLVVRDGGVDHLVIPHFSERGSSSFTHLVEGRHDLVVIGGVKCGIEDEVGLHGLDPSGGVGGFSREVGRKCCFELGGFRHDNLGGGLGLLG